MKTYEEAIKEAAEQFVAIKAVDDTSEGIAEFRGMRKTIAFVYNVEIETVNADIKSAL